MSIEIFKDTTNKGKWCIRNGLVRTNAVVDKLSEQNLLTIYRQIGKIMKIPDWKAEMEKDKRSYLSDKKTDTYCVATKFPSVPCYWDENGNCTKHKQVKRKR